MSRIDDFTTAYRGLLALAPAQRCRVEDRHAGKWWPAYAVRALRHLETGCPPTPWRSRSKSPCDDCRRARAEGFPASR